MANVSRIKFRKSIIFKLIVSSFIILSLIMITLIIYSFNVVADLIAGSGRWLLLPLVYKILLTGAILIILFLVIFYIILRRIFLPINYLIDAYNQVAKGDFTARIFIKNEDEFKEITNHFNNMVVSLESLFSEIKTQKDQIMTIINSLTDGLIVIDKYGKVIICNTSFKNIIGNSDLEGKFYWEIFRDRNFSEVIDAVKKSKTLLSLEITYHSSTFQCLTGYIPSKDEILVTWHDITESFRVERMKKDFIINVSHELRTPLTAIKGFVETLEEGAKPDQLHDLDIIKRNTERLIYIVKDLMVLSEFEDTRFKPAYEPVSVQELLGNTLKIFEKRIHDRGLEIETTPAEVPSMIQADPFMIEQVFINLIDNAIKYTEKGGIRITITGIEGYVEVSIKDTGIGIPEGDQSRIFERFFVVDKSRSRKLGGTGLGLSIVKHIIMIHHGTIQVKSREGEGTEFILHFPLGRNRGL